MKRFRFRPQILLDLKRAKLRQAEAEAALLVRRQQLSLQRAEDLERQAESSAAETRALDPLRGGDLARDEAWTRRLGQERAAAVEARRRLGEQLDEARRGIVELNREIKLLERLKDKAERLHRALEDREIENAAAESALSRRLPRR